MLRRLAPLLLALPLVLGCAGPSKLAQRSEEKLAGGDHWRAWQLATKALDKDPGNARARAAAAAAGSRIAQDWERRIHALCDVDTLAAAEQVLEFADFRGAAVPYAAITLSPEGLREQMALRQAAARIHYKQAVVASESRRPKKAFDHFTEVERYVPGFRDAARRAERAFEKAITRVAFVPFAASSRDVQFGREVADRWRDDIARHLSPPAVRFTRIMGGAAIEQSMTVSQLGRVSREDAVRVGRKAGAQRVVWGSIGDVTSETRLHLFKDVVARRIAEKDSDGNVTVRWVDVPIEVVARVRDVTVEVEYEVIATQDGGSLAHDRGERSSSARVVWTSYAPEGDLDTYALVSEVTRAANPERAKDVETRWKSTCGEKTTLRQVLEARRSTAKSARYDRGALPRFIAGAAFVFLEDLPPKEDLAFAALAQGWGPLHKDLVRLDAVDDVDLGLAVSDPEGR
jgi:hypothetical protein